VKVTASVNNIATVDINALVVGTGAVDITGSGTIRPASGAVVIATSGTVQNNIDFGAAEGIIHVGAISSIDGVISGSNGVTKAGDFSLTTAAAHTYTGPTTINAGGFRFSNPDAFNTTSGFKVRSIGGQELVPTLDYRGTGTATISKPAVVESGVMRLANGTPLAPERAMVYSGEISGPGSVFLEQGAITLTANNTYTGITRISRAEVELFSDSNFGAGNVVELAGTIGRGLVLMNDWNTNKLIRVTETSRLDTNGFNATWNNGAEASDALTKVGLGTLRINGFSPSMSTQFWDIGTSTETGGKVEVDGHARMALEVNDGVLAARGTFHAVRTFSDKTTLQPGDIGGPAVGEIDAASMIITIGTHIDVDLGASSDLLKSHTTLNRGSGGTGPVTFDFRVDPSTTLGTYTLIEYFENPSVALTFVPSDFAFTSNVPGFDGIFSMPVLPNGWQSVQFTVTAVPEPATIGALAFGAFGLLARRRGR
jgi:autotransporter-associated beta strand protein